MKKKIAALVFIISLAFFASAAQGTTHDFYKGQTVRILVGFSAGGGFDTCRLQWRKSDRGTGSGSSGSRIVG
jgi:tripartite-type tricarboxylate transporter receptor subunit TctC